MLTQITFIIKTLIISAIILSFNTGCITENADNIGRSTPPQNQVNTSLDSQLTPIATMESYYQSGTSNISVTVKGTVTRILQDDTVGDKHQRFIIKMENSRTLLIAHNIDLSSRIQGLLVSNLVYVHGEYVWNNEGGLVHWTHDDPAGKHENGWIVYNGIKYK